MQVQRYVSTGIYTKNGNLMYEVYDRKTGNISIMTPQQLEEHEGIMIDLSEIYLG